MAKKYGEMRNYDVIFEGILKKSPPQKPKAFFNFITKRWKKRHFVLFKMQRPSQLYMLYFKVDPTPECKNIGDIDLTKLINLSADVGTSVNRSNVFSIQTSDEKGDLRVYFLCAQSYELMNKWVEKLVTCLNLNGNKSLSNSQLSPIVRNLTRSMPRVTKSFVSSPKPVSAIMSFNSLTEDPRFSFINTNERTNDTTQSSYYNLSPGGNTFFQDQLEDPISTEEDDIYKSPCEESYQHAYVNLDDDEPTPSAIKTKLPVDLFFSNNENQFHDPQEVKSVDVPYVQELKSPIDDTIFEYQNLPSYQFDNQLLNLSSENKSMENDMFDFDFPLPTRIRSESTSSSSSSSSNSSSSMTEMIMDHRVTAKSLDLTENLSPPRVPKRLNLPDTVKKQISTETVLPIKTPKSVLGNSDSLDQTSMFSDDDFSSLNYVDAECLMIGHRQNSKSETCRDSNYASLDVTLGHFHNYQMSTPESKFLPDLSCIGCETPSCTDDNNPSTMFTGAVSTVEYREICNNRTEALMMLNVRIQKKDK